MPIDCERCDWGCEEFAREPCWVCGCRNFRGHSDDATAHYDCKVRVNATLSRLADQFWAVGLLYAGAHRGADKMIDVATKRLDHYEQYREPGLMQTKPATFAVLEEVILLMMAARRRL